MEHLKKYWLLYLIIISALYFAYTKNWFGLFLGNNGKKINSTGSDPNPADCGMSQRPADSGSSLACTSPLYATGKIALSSGFKQVNERCFTLDEIGGIQPDEGTSIKLPYPYNNVKWSFNRQMGAKYCFVDNTNYPCSSYDCSPQ